MEKQKLSSLAYELKRIAEELIDKQKDRELVMPHMKDGKTDQIIATAFNALVRKYNSLLKTAIATNFLTEEDTIFFTELKEDSFGEVLVDSSLLGRYLREEKTIKITSCCQQNDGDQIIDTEIEEMEIDEERLADEEEKLHKMEEILHKKKYVVNLKINKDDNCC